MVKCEYVFYRGGNRSEEEVFIGIGDSDYDVADAAVEDGESSCRVTGRYDCCLRN